MPTTPPDEVIVATRASLHAVAEHLIAADLYHHTGRIGLRPTPGGFGTPPFIVDGTTRQLRVDRNGLVVRHGHERTSHPFTTLGQLAEESGVTPGAPADVYSPTTPLDLDAPLTVDPEAVTHLGHFLRIGAEALERLASDFPHETPTPAQLWPEHFDLAIAMSEITYGACLGDSSVELPYFYVSPWAARVGDFWDRPWGSAAVWAGSATAEDAHGHFLAGHDHAAADPRI